MLNKLDPETGEKSDIGEFIHGNRNSSTLGQYVSHGCMRMDNDVIKELAANAKRGDIVLITE
jgi:lipoprotein-anchoring transpeptidase ErfK/SrfK